MEIAVLGSGHIGGNLGKLFAKAGHQVFFGVRDPDALSGLLKDAGPNAQAGVFDQAFAFADMVVEALPFHVTLELPADKVADKVLVTAANCYAAFDGEIDLHGLSHSEAPADGQSRQGVQHA